VATEKNKLYYGDNCEVLKRYVKDETVDLVYLDPPFNSRQDYNVLFAEKDGSQSSSQIHAFEDTWEWNIDAQRSFEFIVEQGGRVADALRAFKTFLFNTDMMAYLAMMAPRLIELRRVSVASARCNVQEGSAQQACGCGKHDAAAAARRGLSGIKWGLNPSVVPQKFVALVFS
jgi:hypothetical protein